MKQPNGYGSVHKLPGKRRKPWRVRKTNGWAMNEDGTKLVQQYITIGYYETRQEALQALADYNQDPYDIKNTTSTFTEVYEKWSAEHFDEICASAVRTWKSAYNHSKPLWDMRMRDIRAAHLEQTIKDETRNCQQGLCRALQSR